MRAFVLAAHEGPSSIALQEVPDPSPGRGEVVVAIRATAINRADLLQCMGRYAGPPMEPEIPGLELAGEVIEQGPGAERFEVGARVAALVAGGAFAERIAVHERLLLPLPDSIDAEAAGGLPETYLTAFDAMVVQGGIAPSARVLIHAGASGVGTAAIQIALEHRARVAATCSAAKVVAVRGLGAELVVDYRSEDVADRVRHWAPGGVDVIVNPVGAAHLDADLRCASVKARIIVLGLLGGREATIDLARLLSSRVALIGSVLRSRPIEEKMTLVQRFAREMMPAVDAGRLRPVIDRVYPFAELPSALEYMATNQSVGKIVVTLP